MPLDSVVESRSFGSICERICERHGTFIDTVGRRRRILSKNGRGTSIGAISSMKDATTSTRTKMLSPYSPISIPFINE